MRRGRGIVERLEGFVERKRGGRGYVLFGVSEAVDGREIRELTMNVVFRWTIITMTLSSARGKKRWGCDLILV